MWSDKTKVVRGVLAFLAGCAVLGFVMGLRGAMPADETDYDADAPLSTPSGVVVEAAPVQDTPPPVVVEEEPEAKEEPQEEEPAAPEPAPDPEPAPQPKAKAAPPPAPPEEAPPADPVGDLIEATPPPLADLY